MLLRTDFRCGWADVTLLCLCLALIPSAGCGQKWRVDRLPVDPWKQRCVQHLLDELSGDHLLTLMASPSHGGLLVHDRWSDGRTVYCNLYFCEQGNCREDDLATGTPSRTGGRVYAVESASAVRMFRQLYETTGDLLSRRKNPLTEKVATRDASEIKSMFFQGILVTGKAHGWGETVGEYVLTGFLQQARLWDEELDEDENTVGTILVAETDIKNMVMREVAARPEILVHYLLDHFDVYMAAMFTHHPEQGEQSVVPAQADEGGFNMSAPLPHWLGDD